MKFIAKHKVIIFLVGLLVVIALVGQKLLNKEDNTYTNTTTTDTAKIGTITESISASGKVLTSNYMAVTTSVNGIVSKVYVKEGDIVKKDQKIMDVVLDSEGEKSRQNSYASYLRAKNSLDSAKNQLLSLENSMINAKEAFDNEKESNDYQSHDDRISYKIAENTYNNAKNGYDQQKQQIDQLTISLNSAWLDYLTQSPTILAPSDGVIANIVAVEGSKIENSVTSDRTVKTVASIKKEGTPIISVDVSELDINKVTVGQKVNVTLNSIANTIFTGTVAGIDKIGSISGGVTNYPVIVKLDKQYEDVLPNMSVDAEIIISSKDNVVYVPTSAIKTINDKKYVNVLTQNGTSNTEVQIGLSDGTNTEIVSGVNQGDTVSISALPTSGFTSSSSNSRSSGFMFFGGPGR